MAQLVAVNKVYLATIISLFACLPTWSKSIRLTWDRPISLSKRLTFQYVQQYTNKWSHAMFWQDKNTWRKAKMETKNFWMLVWDVGLLQCLLHSYIYFGEKKVSVSKKNSIKWHCCKMWLCPPFLCICQYTTLVHTFYLLRGAWSSASIIIIL